MGTRARCLRILYVEDHADTVSVMARLLRAEGHTVVTAGTCGGARAAAAAAAAAGQPFDLLITDIGLRDGDGRGLLGEIRERSPVRGIVLSGYGMAADLARSSVAGFDEHLTKPVDIL